MPRRPLARLAWLALLMLMTTSVAVAEEEKPRPPGAVYEVDLDDEDVPNFLERTVEFMWLEHGRLWKDRFRARVYPRQPIINQRSRINLLVRRYRDGLIRGKPDPQKTEIHIRRSTSGRPVTHTIKRPGASVSFDYEFTHVGEYSVRIVTFYSDIETYTVTLHFTVVLEPPPEDDD